ncbi:MAG: hypothetical protein ACW98Y_14250, partial [Candidatus Thorarchaeota archaeon]
MSWEKFLECVHTADFERSTRILSESANADTLNLFAEQIEGEIETQGHKPLPFRDHVFNFLLVSSVYNSLNIPCYEILRKFAGYSDVEELQYSTFKWIVSLIEENSDDFMQHVLEIEDLADSDLVTTIPDILSRRAKEIEKTMIPFSSIKTESETRDRFFINPLWLTAYGRKVLLALGKDVQTTVVGRSSWNEIRDALADLGYNGEDMLHDIDVAQWHSLTVSFRTSSSNLILNPELSALAKCQSAYAELDSPRQKSRVDALAIIDSLG